MEKLHPRVLFGGRRSYRTKYLTWEWTSREQEGLGPGLGQRDFKSHSYREYYWAVRDPTGARKAGNKGACETQVGYCLTLSISFLFQGAGPPRSLYSTS